jgi:hypothetical protein
MDIVFCTNCQKDVHPAIALNGASQIAPQCPRCTMPLGDALTAPLAAYDKANERPRPVAKPGSVVEIRPGASKPAASAPRKTASLSDIVEDARAQLAEIDIRIPSLEAELAGAKAHRRGLSKMIAAYDKAAAKPE